MLKWKLSPFKTWPNIFLKGRNKVKLCKVHPFFWKERSLVSACPWIYEERPLLTNYDYRSWTFLKLILKPLTTSLQELLNYLFKQSERMAHPTKYMYKYAIYFCTKTSLMFLLAVSGAFYTYQSFCLGFPSFFHQLSQISSQGWA